MTDNARFLAEVWRYYADQATPGPNVADPDAWRAAIRNRAHRLAPEATLLAERFPKITADRVAAALHAHFPADMIAEQLEHEATGQAGRRLATLGMAQLAENRAVERAGNVRRLLAEARANIAAAPDTDELVAGLKAAGCSRSWVRKPEGPAAEARAQLRKGNQ